MEQREVSHIPHNHSDWVVLLALPPDWETAVSLLARELATPAFQYKTRHLSMRIMLIFAARIGR